MPYLYQDVASRRPRNFRVVLDDLDDPKVPRVCLLAGSLSGDVLADRQLNRSILDEMKLFLRTFSEHLALAKKKGELPRDYDPEVAAQVIVTYLQGLFRVVRVLQDRDQMERQIDVLLSGLSL